MLRTAVAWDSSNSGVIPFYANGRLMIPKPLGWATLGFVVGIASIVSLYTFGSGQFDLHSCTAQPDFFMQNCENGSCHERADVPSPRTPYSAWTAVQLSAWFSFQRELVLVATANSGVGSLFIGDSITEAFQGTSYGGDCDRCNGRSHV